MSKNEFSALQNIMEAKNKSQIINDSDKNLGAVLADKEDVVIECKRQLYDISTYIKLSLEEMEILIAKVKAELSEVVRKYKSNNLCSSKEKEFLFTHFYIIWKILKNPIANSCRLQLDSYSCVNLCGTLFKIILFQI